MNIRRTLSILCAALATAGLHGGATGAFVSVPVKPAGSQALTTINPKINLDTPTETQNRANTLGTINPIEDIIEMAPHVLRHRIMLTPEKEMEGITPDELIASILRSVEVPR